MPRQSQPMTVTVLQKQKQFVDLMVERGTYASASEVVRAGLKALEIQEAHLNDWMREKIREALDDPRPPVPLDEAFDRLLARSEARIRREDSGD